MSHITKIKVEIKDLEALKNAAKEVGLQFNENQKSYRHYYGKNTCDHAIVVPNSRDAYEVGVVRNGDKYELQLDQWSGGYGLEDLAGSNCSNLTDTYTKEVAVKEAKKFAQAQGYSFNQEYDKQTNEVVLKLRKY